MTANPFRSALRRASTAAVLAFGVGASASAVPSLSGCSPSTSSPTVDPRPLAVGESRAVELRFLRFDVSNFEQTLTRKDVLALPVDVQSRLWLLDLDLTSGPNAPRLLDNALAAIKALDPQSLSVAARNLQRLLKMTPSSAELHGTSLEKLTELAPLLGLAPERVVADLLKLDVDDTFLSSAVVSEAILKQVISTHPNTQTRLGPKTVANPLGVYPVTPGTLPITLADAAADFGTLAARYGEYSKNGVYHPGFIVGDTRAKVLTDDFKITVRANANALPYKGLKLADASPASVNSVRSQIANVFDFDDPNWLTIDGLTPGTPVIDSLTFRVVEDHRFIAGGLSPVPRPYGSSDAWKLAPWSLDRVLIGAAQASFAHLQQTLSYSSPTRTDPLFSATVDHGWQVMDVVGGIGSPPSPSYVWDILLEVAQVRLHDGNIAEGEANAEFTLKGIPVGTDSSVIERTIRENLRADPSSLVDIASRIVDNTDGAADLYYYRSNPRNSEDKLGDWLFFVAEGDLDEPETDRAKRTYRYRHPGFFRDAELTEKASTRDSLDADVEHEKVKIDDGASLYAEDESGAVFRIDVGAKPNLTRRSMTITRVR